MPLESQKAGIVNDLVRMNANMRQFSNDIEEKIDRVIKETGMGKKFGIGPSAEFRGEDFQDSELNKIMSNANKFIAAHGNFDSKAKRPALLAKAASSQNSFASTKIITPKAEEALPIKAGSRGKDYGAKPLPVRSHRPLK